MLKDDEEILGLRPCPFGRAVKPELEPDPDADAEPVELGSFDSLDGTEPELGFLARPDPDPDPDADPGDGRTGLLTVTLETIGPEPGFLGLSPKKPSMVEERSGAVTVTVTVTPV